MKKYKKQVACGVTPEQAKKLEAVSEITGIKIPEIVRQLIDSSLPELDPKDKFWSICKNSSIFKFVLPANTVVPFISSFLNMSVSGKNQVDGIEIQLYAPTGLSPMLWGLTRIKENFYDESISDNADKQSERANDKKIS